MAAAHQRRRRLPHGLTLFELSGPCPNKTLLVFGLVHGDEYEAPMAIARLFERINPRNLSGRILMVPNCNPPAFAAGTRCSPVDGKNLARVFPGKASGTLTEKIAHELTKLIRESDFLIDLHSAGSTMQMARLSGYFACGGERERLQHEACVRFGQPIIWPARTIGPGRSLTAAHKLGVPAIYCEMTGANACRGEEVAAYENGVLAVAAMLGLIPKRLAPRMSRPKRVLRDPRGASNLDTMARTRHAGIWVCRARLLQRVRRGDVLGEVRGLDGKLLEIIRAPRAGTIIILRHAAPVEKGGWLFQLV